MNSSVISIEGNIGSGKSTILEELRKHYGNNSQFCFLTEPVQEWQSICDTDGENIIQKYYKDQNKYAFSFQMMAYITRLKALKTALKDGCKYIVTERSPLSDKFIFAQMLYDDEKIEKINYDIYSKWFSTFLEDLPEIRHMYIKTTPDVAQARVHKRAREGENIPLPYLTKCHEYHESWMKNSLCVLQINGNVDFAIPSYKTTIIESFDKWYFR